MDVTPSRLADGHEVASPGRLTPVAPPAPMAEVDTTAPNAPAEPPWEAHSALKFTLLTADVDAKFEIHEASSRVIVTMYDRETGEVLREFPSRHVLDQIAAVTANGLKVDTTS